MPFQSCIDHLEAFVRYGVQLHCFGEGEGMDDMVMIDLYEIFAF